MKEVKEFVIDRTVWLRGEGARDSRLLRPSDGKMCCLGIYLKACELKDEAISNLTVPASVGGQVPQWLLFQPSFEHTHVVDLMIDNDTPNLSEVEREASIVSGFEKNGIKVTFKG